MKLLVLLALLLPENHVLALIEQLKDKDSEIRQNAAIELGKIGKEAKAAVPALVKALRDKSPFVRMEAMNSLGSIGQQAQIAVPALLQKLKDQNLAEKEAAADALFYFVPDSFVLLKKALDDNDVFTRKAVTAALSSHRGKAIPLLLGVLRKDKNLDVRIAAMCSLCDIGPKASDAVALLVKAVKTEGGRWKKYVPDLLRCFGRSAAVPALCDLLLDKDEGICMRSILELQRFGKDSKQATPQLVRLLKHSNDQIREFSAQALGSIGPGAESALKNLKIAIKIDKSAFVRASAGLALKQIDRHNNTGIQFLFQALNSKDVLLRRVGATKMGVFIRCGIDKTLTIKSTLALVTALGDENETVRGDAAWALAEAGPRAKAAIPALTVALKDKCRHVRLGAEYALSRIQMN